MPRPGPLIARISASIGLLCMVSGTFLPWFHSGNIERNSYQTVAIADHFALLGSGFVGQALRYWIAVPTVAALCVVLFALGVTRWGAALTTILAILVGTVGAACAVQASTKGMVGVTSTGPVVTIVGTVVAVAGALAAVITTRRHRATETRRAGVPQ